MRRRLALAFIALLAFSTVAVACGDDSDDTSGDVAEANTAFCEDLGAYADSIAALAALDPATATKADYESAVDAVKSARTDMVESGADLTEAEFANLQSQAEDLEGALSDAPDDAAVADILTGAEAQVAKVKASAATLGTAVCTPAGATTTAAG